MRSHCNSMVAFTLIAVLAGPVQMALPAGEETPAIIHDSSSTRDGESLPQSPLPTLVPLSGLPATPVVGVDCSDCRRTDRFWVEGDYLFWWLKPGPLGTPLVTTDPSQGVAKGSGGLANPTTQVLLGAHDIDFAPFSGGRLRAGYMLGDGIGIEAGAFLLQQQTNDQISNSDKNGSPFLLRPIVNTDANNLNAGIVVSLPLSSALALGASAANTGAVEVNSRSQLWGSDAVVTANGLDLGNTRLTALGGFRYFDLRESTDVFTAITDTAAGITFGGVRDVPGDRLLLSDSFHTHNQFYGGQMGCRSETQLGAFVLSAEARVSLGDTQQVTTISGSTSQTAVAGGGTQTLPGGWLALPSNSGTFHHDAFTVVPEANLKVGYDVRPWLRLGVGYDFLFWSSVVRPGDQMLPEASAGAKVPPPFGQVPTFPGVGPGAAPIPPVPYNTTSFWAHGLSFSAQFRF
jgi:Putative beta barrel porin-7 (BBP7)